MKKILIILTIIAAPWWLSAQSMNIESGAFVTIEVGASMTTGAITNSASTAGDGLIIKSTAAGSGSLICTGTPTATVERYVTTTRWNMVSPTTTGTTGQTFFDASGSDSWLVWFDEATGTGDVAGTGWTYHELLTDPVSVGSGYNYWPDVAETVEFKGNLQSTNLSPTITWLDASHGYNLIGNPFSSALLWDGTWTMTHVNNAIWIWNGTQYEAQPGGLSSHYVPIGQGFFVRSNASGPSITIPSAKRAHNSQAFLKNGQKVTNSDFSHLIIDAQNNQYQDRVFIYFDDNGTDSYDDGFDATKMFGLAEAPQLYLVENDLKQTYDFLPTLTEGEERTVAMSYIAGAAGEQKLIANFSYFTGANVTLEDLKTGDTQNLSENGTYSFTGSKDDSPERFLLHFAWSPDGIGDEISDVSSNIQIYSYGKDVYIRSNEEAINQNGNVFVYDLMGCELAQEKIIGTELIKFLVNACNTYVVVKVVKDGSTKTQKVYIK